jgi:protein SCO1/2
MRSRIFRLVFTAAALVAGGYSPSASAASIEKTSVPSAAVPNEVRWEQKVGAGLSLNVPVLDEKGRLTSLAPLLRQKPLLLTFVYFRCPNLCTLVLNGIVDALRAGTLKVGRDFNLASISINPEESSNLALTKKRSYLARLDQAGDDNPVWRFLTAPETTIRTLTDEAGFHFKYDPVTHDYAHPSGFIVLTPTGRISRTFFGIRFDPLEIRQAISDASIEQSHRNFTEIILNCLHYNPEQGRYGPLIQRLLQVLGLLTVVMVGGLLFALSRRRKS